MFVSWCKKLGFPEESITVLENAYIMLKEKTDVKFKQARRGLLMPSTAEFEDATSEIIAQTNIHPYTLNAVLTVSVLDEMQEKYEQKNLLEKFDFYMERLPLSLNDCKEKYGIWGVKEALWNWLFHFLNNTKIGRFNFETYYHYSKVEYKGVKRGDPVIFIHIPTGEPLDTEEVTTSLKLGYEYFKHRFKNGIVPFITDTWLIYPPFLHGVFKKGGNLEKFAALFETLEQKEDANYADFGLVFKIPYSKENLEKAPQETSLQRNMLKFIKEGNRMGQGYGIFFYGENGIIK